MSDLVAPPVSADKPKGKLLDQVRDVMRLKHYSLRTERTYCDWIERFIRFHHLRHPCEMAEREVGEFLTDLVRNGNVTASTQNQALSALLFLYKQVLKQEIGWLEKVQRAKKPARLPVVLTRDEVRRVLSHLHGTASLLYGSGLRLMECVRLRVKDIDFAYAHITVRDTKGGRDRITMLPVNLAAPLQRHLEKIKAQHTGIWLMVSAKSGCRTRLTENIRALPASGAGSMPFPPRAFPSIRVPAKSGGIILMKARCNRP